MTVSFSNNPGNVSIWLDQILGKAEQQNEHLNSSFFKCQVILLQLSCSKQFFLDETNWL